MMRSYSSMRRFNSKLFGVFSFVALYIYIDTVHISDRDNSKVHI